MNTDRSRREGERENTFLIPRASKLKLVLNVVISVSQHRSSWHQVLEQVAPDNR